MYFFHCVLGVLRIGPILCDEGCDFIEQFGQLEGIYPFLEEAGILGPKLSLGAIGSSYILLHDLIEDQLIDLVALCLLEGDVVQPKADMCVV